MPHSTTSAARFLGNTLARLQTDALWHTFEDGTMLVGNRVIKFDVDTALTHILSGNRALGQRFSEVVQTWREDSDAGEATDAAARSGGHTIGFLHPPGATGHHVHRLDRRGHLLRQPLAC